MSLNSKSIIIALLVVLAIGAGGTAFYFYSQYSKTQEQLKDPNKAARQETQAIIDDMSKVIDLPAADLKNGEPTLATVLDKSKLKDQPFFDNAENGDKVLIYTKAKKAFLWRPSTKKVINVAPVTIGQGQEVKVALRSAGGNTTKVSDNLRQSYPNVTITGTDNAASNSTKTLVIDLSGNNPDAANSIAKSINGTVSSLPAGESKPSGADFLIIVGSDYK